MGIASLSSHRKVLTAAKDSLVNKLSTAAGTVAVIVELTGGMQAGQKRRLTLPSLTLGSRVGSDVVLMDADVAETHAVVSFERSAFGMLAQIQAMEASVEVDGKTVARGTVVTDVTLPFELQAGSARMRFVRPTITSSVETVEDVDDDEGFDEPSTPKTLAAAQAAKKAKAVQMAEADAVDPDPAPKSKPVRPKRRKKIAVDPVLALGAIGLVLIAIGGLFWHLVNDRASYVIDVNRPATITEEPLRSDVEWAVEARSQIAALGLEDLLRVDVLSNRILQTTGQVPSADRAQYEELIGWYDGQSNAPSMVWDVQQRRPLARLPNIGMVRFSSPAAVVLTSGNLVSVGEELVDGWVLASVEPSTLNLRRGTESQQVQFRTESE